MIEKMRTEGVQSIEATQEAEQEWRREVIELGDKTLLPETDSWYMGANIPGKPREHLNYTGVFPMY